MAHGALTLTKEEMARGLASGRTLIQEEWAHPLEHQWIEELIAEGVAQAEPWEWRASFQCERRRITGRAAQKSEESGR